MSTINEMRVWGECGTLVYIEVLVEIFLSPDPPPPRTKSLLEMLIVTTMSILKKCRRTGGLF